MPDVLTLSIELLLFESPKENQNSNFSENYIFDGETYFYRDESGTKHKWNQTSNQWEQQEVELFYHFSCASTLLL